MICGRPREDGKMERFHLTTPRKKKLQKVLRTEQRLPMGGTKSIKRGSPLKPTGLARKEMGEEGVLLNQTLIVKKLNDPEKEPLSITQEKGVCSQKVSTDSWDKEEALRQKKYRKN